MVSDMGGGGEQSQGQPLPNARLCIKGMGPRRRPRMVNGEHLPFKARPVHGGSVTQLDHITGLFEAVWSHCLLRQYPGVPPALPHGATQVPALTRGNHRRELLFSSLACRLLSDIYMATVTNRKLDKMDLWSNPSKLFLCTICMTDLSF